MLSICDCSDGQTDSNTPRQTHRQTDNSAARYPQMQCGVSIKVVSEYKGSLQLVLCIGSNLGLKFGRERPIRHAPLAHTRALTDFCPLTLWWKASLQHALKTYYLNVLALKFAGNKMAAFSLNDLDVWSVCWYQWWPADLYMCGYWM